MIQAVSVLTYGTGLTPVHAAASKGSGDCIAHLVKVAAPLVIVM